MEFSIAGNQEHQKSLTGKGSRIIVSILALCTTELYSYFRIGSGFVVPNMDNCIQRLICSEKFQLFEEYAYG
jgi:hypothetical protein